MVCELLLYANTDLHLRNKKNVQVPMLNLCNSIETAEIPDVIDPFVKAGVDLDVRDWHGETSLMNAVYKRYTSIARKLVELGANVNISDHSPQAAPVHLAVLFDSF